MSQYLELKGYKWTAINADYMKVPANSNIRYVLKVDIKYLKTFHDALKDYPLTPEHLTDTNIMLSPYEKSNSFKKLTLLQKRKMGFEMHKLRAVPSNY